jgi:transcription elongation factor Elf1
MLDVDLKETAAGYAVVRKECPRCKAVFFFRFPFGKDGKFRGVTGDALGRFEEGKLKGNIRCTVCNSKYKVSIREPSSKVNVKRLKVKRCKKYGNL